MVGNHPKTEELLLEDQLKSTTRKDRRSLLLSSTIGIIFVKTGLIPSKIEAYGIVITESERSNLFTILILIIFYFFITFIVRSTYDIMNWNMRLRSSARALEISPGENAGYRELLVADREISMKLKSLPVLKLFFEIVIPIALGSVAIYWFFKAV